MIREIRTKRPLVAGAAMLCAVAVALLAVSFSRPPAEADELSMEPVDPARARTESSPPQADDSAPEEPVEIDLAEAQPADATNTDNDSAPAENIETASEVAAAEAASETTDTEADAGNRQPDVADAQAPAAESQAIPVTRARDGQAVASEAEPPQWVRRWAVLADEFEAKKAANGQAHQPVSPAQKVSAPPVVATIDGTGGGLLTPSAYLLNPGPAGQVFGMPTMGNRFLRFGSKDVATFTIGETLWGRVELSYGLQQFGLGGFNDAVENRLGRDIVREEAYLHTWSIRGLLIEEDSLGPWTPAVTAGVSFKYNDSIQTIDRRMGHALRAAGLDKSNGIDWTLTASKTFCEPWAGRPVVFSGGLRLSNAAQMGWMGFDNSCHLTLEGSVKYFPADWLAIGYEFRGKADPYEEVPGVYGDEDAAHAITADVHVTENLTLSTGWMLMGHVANGSGDCGWTLGMQWDF